MVEQTKERPTEVVRVRDPKVSEAARLTGLLAQLRAFSPLLETAFKGLHAEVDGLNARVDGLNTKVEDNDKKHGEASERAVQLTTALEGEVEGTNEETKDELTNVKTKLEELEAAHNELKDVVAKLGNALNDSILLLGNELQLIKDILTTYVGIDKTEADPLTTGQVLLKALTALEEKFETRFRKVEEWVGQLLPLRFLADYLGKRLEKKPREVLEDVLKRFAAILGITEIERYHETRKLSELIKQDGALKEIADTKKSDEIKNAIKRLANLLEPGDAVNKMLEIVVGGDVADEYKNTAAQALVTEKIRIYAPLKELLRSIVATNKSGISRLTEKDKARIASLVKEVANGDEEMRNLANQLSPETGTFGEPIPE